MLGIVALRHRPHAA